MQIDSAGQTHVGRRPHNEDAYCVLPELGLFVVADGLGGQEGGEVASRCVVDTFAGLGLRLEKDRDATWPDAVDPRRSREENMLAACAALAQRNLIAQRVGRLREMASTVVALAVGEHGAAVVHVGDSRLYRLRDGKLEALTRDHSLIEELRAAGMEPPGGPANLRHLITRALGTDNAEPTVQRLDARTGDVFLLCSDGLYEPLGLDGLVPRLHAATAQEACDALVSAAFEAGGRDNITAVVLRVPEA
ncbi:serine/threonine-protein phosphatase [Corallococcus sp. H22C18031201]|uniref:PP2C family protein-serine/threonine phosphatase n=1 Tax=Citreicoccus inhibens TaxID=2849499 RepID=UPI000E755C3E|nr:PP2C family serine/threonine-protein phosphatase [Citreicoccus inhibens]MBU8894361.1 serine/threonine-protein phosphatase [Citreicoccus inhibens]RJS16172.1 serine/threonine-protein phosphatase [Corallococcus sp. H22C18031201]